MQLNLLRKSTLSVEGALKVSQQIKIPLLIGVEEMSDLFTFLENRFPNFRFYNTSGVVKSDDGIMTPSEFVTTYEHYVQALQKGLEPDAKTFHAYFASSLSVTSDIFYEISLPQETRIIKASKPPIQLQPHHIVYSRESNSLYSMAYSQESITFGFQLSYPNIYQDPHTHDIVDVDESELFPNTALFKALRIWIREYTAPTPFVMDGKKVNYPIRLGKNCFSWINNHAQLKKNQLYVNSRNP